MATLAHCAFCFECLAASFERRRPLDLAQVEDLWDEYHTSTDFAPPTGAGASEDDGEEADEDDDADMTDADVEQPPKPAAISRLLNRETSAGSSSSSLQSTKSTTSSVKSQKNPSSGADTPASSTSSLRSPSSRPGPKGDYPLFITWNTVSRSGYRSLRGCIGTFEPLGLEHGLRSYALTSAFEDVRFQPIPAHLLPQLSNHVTLLTDFSQPTKDPLDWTLGTHGIRISFIHHNRRYGATYLPDVAEEQGWTKDETMISLMRKAGWSGRSGDWTKVWREGKGELVRYEGKQVGLNYDEWKTWRDWVEKEGVKSKALN